MGSWDRVSYEHAEEQPPERPLRRGPEPKIGDRTDRAFSPELPDYIDHVRGSAERHPVLGEVLRNPEAKASFEDLWTRSDVTDYDHRHEEGGWIVYDTSTGTSRVEQVPSGERASIRPGDPPPLASTERVAGFFHTHPNPSIDEIGNRWSEGPSLADTRWSDHHQVPLVVRSEWAYHVYYPSEQRK